MDRNDPNPAPGSTEVSQEESPIMQSSEERIASSDSGSGETSEQMQSSNTSCPSTDEMHLSSQPSEGHTGEPEPPQNPEDLDEFACQLKANPADPTKDLHSEIVQQNLEVKPGPSENASSSPGASTCGLQLAFGESEIPQFGPGPSTTVPEQVPTTSQKVEAPSSEKNSFPNERNVSVKRVRRVHRATSPLLRGENRGQDGEPSSRVAQGATTPRVCPYSTPSTSRDPGLLKKNASFSKGSQGQHDTSLGAGIQGSVLNVSTELGTHHVYAPGGSMAGLQGVPQTFRGSLQAPSSLSALNSSGGNTGMLLTAGDSQSARGSGSGSEQQQPRGTLKEILEDVDQSRAARDVMDRLQQFFTVSRQELDKLYAIGEASAIESARALNAMSGIPGYPYKHSGQKPSAQRPTGQMPSGQIPSGHMPAGQIPCPHMPSGQMPSGQTLPGQMPPGQKRSGQKRSGQMFTRQMPSGQMSSGQMPSGQMFTRQIPSGQIPSGSMSSDQMPSGQIPSGSMSSGQIPSGQMPSGQMPSGQMLSGQLPSSQRNYGQMPYGQMSYGQMPSGQIPRGPMPTWGIPPTTMPMWPMSPAQMNTGPMLTRPMPTGPILTGSIFTGPIPTGTSYTGPMPIGSTPAGPIPTEPTSSEVMHTWSVYTGHVPRWLEDAVRPHLLPMLNQLLRGIDENNFPRPSTSTQPPQIAARNTQNASSETPHGVKQGVPQGTPECMTEDISLAIPQNSPSVSSMAPDCIQMPSTQRSRKPPNYEPLVIQEVEDDGSRARPEDGTEEKPSLVESASFTEAPKSPEIQNPKPEQAEDCGPAESGVGEIERAAAELPPSLPEDMPADVEEMNQNDLQSGPSDDNTPAGEEEMPPRRE